MSKGMVLPSDKENPRWSWRVAALVILFVVAFAPTRIQTAANPGSDRKIASEVPNTAENKSTEVKVVESKTTEVKSPVAVVPVEKSVEPTPTKSAEVKSTVVECEPSLTPQKPLGFFSISPRFEFSNYRVEEGGTQRTVRATPQSVLGLDLGWKRQLSDETAFFFGAGFKRYSLEAPAAPVSLSDENPTTYHFDLALQKSITPKLRVDLSLGYGQSLSLSGLDSTTLSVDLAKIFTVGTGLEWRLLEKGDGLVLGLLGEAKYLFNGSTSRYATSPGRFGLIEAFAIDTNETKNYRLGIGYQMQKFSTSFSEVYESAITIRFGIEFNTFK